VLEVSGDQLERVGVEDREQLLVGQAEQVLQPRGAQNADTLAVMACLSQARAGAG